MLTDEQYIRSKMQEFKDRKDNKVVNKPEQKTNKDKAIEILNTILDGVSKIYNRQGIIKSQQDEMIRLLGGFSKSCLRSTIPYMTPKQLYSCSLKGFTVEELAAISGYKEDDVIKKINSYQNV